MKFHRLNPKKHKLFIRWIETYLLLVAILAAVTIPIYLQSYQEVQNSVISDTRLSIEHGLSQLQNELNTYYAILESLKSNGEYKWVIDLSGVPSLKDYVHIAALQKYYRDMLLSSFIQENTFIMFAQNNIILSKFSAFNDMRDFYGSIWDFDGFTYDEMRQVFFSKKYYGEFLPGMRFRELETKQNCDIVFAFTVSGGQENGGAMLFSVYETNKIMSLLGLDQIAESGQVRLRNSRGEEILTVNRIEGMEEGAPDVSITASNSCMTVEVIIPDDFYTEKLSSTRNMLTAYMILFLTLGIGLSLIFAYRNGKPLKNLIKLLSVDGEEYQTENEYEFIRDYIDRLSRRNALTQAQMLDNMLVKLLFVGLSAKEQEKFKKLVNGHFVSASLVLMKSDVLNWEKPFDARLEREPMLFYKAILIDPFTEVVFFDGASMDKEWMNSIIFDLSREYNFRLKGAMSTPYPILSKTVEVFGRLRELIKYAEYCMLLSYDTNSTHKTNIDYVKGYFANSKLLREYLRSGNEVEANKLVYKQWYQLSVNLGTNDDIANLFYYQTGILSEIAIDIGLKIPLPIFENENDILTNALNVAQYIERLCEYVNSRTESGDQTDVEILKYINNHYCEPSFYLITLSEKFNLSTRTVTRIVKQITGRTFSEYLKIMRLSHAARLLKETKMSVQDIAAQSGFESTNSLLKSFKKEYNVSPTEFRRNSNNFTAKDASVTKKLSRPSGER